MTTKVFIFDLDGTLIENKAFYYALNRLRDLLNIPYSNEFIMEKFHDVYRSFVVRGDLRTAFDWDVITKLTLTNLGFKPPKENIFSEIFIEYINKKPPRIRKGTIPLLTKIRSMNYSSVLLTNGRRRFQEPLIRKLGLDKYLHHILTNDDVPKAKPYKEAFQKAVKVVGTEEADVYFVGDHLYYDLYGALKAGIRNVFLISNELKLGKYKLRDISQILIDFALERYGLDLSKQIKGILDKEFVIIRDIISFNKLVFDKEN